MRVKAKPYAMKRIHPIASRIAIFCLAGLIFSNAQAENSVRVGKSSYVSASFMYVDYSKQDDEFSKIAVDTAQQFAPLGINEVYAYGVTSDDGFRLAFGTQLTDKLVVELAYMDLGAYQATVEMYSAAISAVSTITVDTKAKSLELKYLLDNIGSFSPHISFGMFSWDSELSAQVAFSDGTSASVPTLYGDDKDSHYGIGGVFEIGPKSRVGFDWRSFNTEVKYSAFSAALELLF